MYEVLRQWDFPELLDHGHLDVYKRQQLGKVIDDIGTGLFQPGAGLMPAGVQHTSRTLSLIHILGRVGPVAFAMSLTAKPDDNKRKIMPVGHINVG